MVHLGKMIARAWHSDILVLAAVTLLAAGVVATLIDRAGTTILSTQEAEESSSYLDSCSAPEGDRTAMFGPALFKP